MHLPRTSLIAIAVSGLALAIAPLAHADDGPAFRATVIAPPLGASAGFVTRAVILPAGTSADFVNLDSASHNVRSDDRDPVTGDPLFGSASVGSGTVPIVGVEDLPPGTYIFRCSIHPTMTGSLVVQ